jgi:hypothetical protein
VHQSGSKDHYQEEILVIRYIFKEESGYQDEGSPYDGVDKK